MLFVAHIFWFAILQEVHAPIISLWGVKLLVISVFVAFSVASIVSSAWPLTSLSCCHMFLLFISVFLLVWVAHAFTSHRHCAPGLNLVWSRRLSFLGIHICRFKLSKLICCIKSSISSICFVFRVILIQQFQSFAGIF